MRRLLDQLTATPVIVLGKRLDILEWNCAAAALYTDFSLIPARGRNCVRLLFTDSVIREMHREWEHDARDAVAALRMEAAADPDDPELAGLVGELSVQDAEFRTWWAEHRVTSSSHGTKLYRHRLVGDLALDCDMWSNPDGSGQRLMVLTAEPGSRRTTLCASSPPGRPGNSRQRVIRSCGDRGHGRPAKVLAWPGARTGRDARRPCSEGGPVRVDR